MLRPPLVRIDRLDHPRPEFPRGEVAGNRVPPDLPRHWPLRGFAHLRNPAAPIPVIDRAGLVPYLRRVSKLDIITLVTAPMPTATIAKRHTPWRAFRAGADDPPRPG